MGETGRTHHGSEGRGKECDAQMRGSVSSGEAGDGLTHQERRREQGALRAGCCGQQPLEAAAPPHHYGICTLQVNVRTGRGMLQRSVSDGRKGLTNG